MKVQSGKSTVKNDVPLLAFTDLLVALTDTMGETRQSYVANFAPDGVRLTTSSTWWSL